jgi:FkbM family methyltransferase
VSFNPQIAPEYMGEFVRQEWRQRFGDAPGRFLDMGAYSLGPPSVTRTFLADGWSGLFVEADPGNCGRLIDDVIRTGTPERAHCLCAALLPNPGITDWYSVIGGGETSSTSKAWTEKPWCAASKYVRASVVAVTPADLLARFGVDWDLVNLDLEGVTLDVFKAIPWPTLSRARMLVAEMHPDDLLPTLAPLGFRVIHSDVVNAVLVRGDK